jgi:23S rRNA pseudouridine1911/1915/1917 synthase
MSKHEESWVWVPFEVDKKYDGYRIDRFLSQRLVGYSRSKVQTILADARVLKEGRPAKANTKVRTGDKIQIAYLRRPEAPLAAQASIPILFEDEDLLIVDKPADLLSHPTDKIVNNTVLGMLRHCRPDLPKLHLLHRLDRETSGVLALAKNAKAARAWTKQMEAHHIQKEYIAIIRGKVSSKEGLIDKPIGCQRGAIRVRQWVNVPEAVPATTTYEVISTAQDHSVVRAYPKTGRLHQIRVHFAAIGHPLLGDPLYTGEGEIYRKMIAGTCTEADRASLGFSRVALHAAALALVHPITLKPLRIEASLPKDMAEFLGHSTNDRHCLTPA